MKALSRFSNTYFNIKTWLIVNIVILYDLDTMLFFILLYIKSNKAIICQ